MIGNMKLTETTIKTNPETMDLDITFMYGSAEDGAMILWRVNGKEIKPHIDEVAKKLNFSKKIN